MNEKRGFTLIELIVAMSVMLLLLGIGSYSISKFTQSRKVMVARNELTTYIKLARNLAITNQLPNKKTNLKYVRVTLSGMTISVVGIDDNGVSFSGFPYFSKTIDAKGVTTGGLLTFGFSGLSGKLTDSNGNLDDNYLSVNVTEGVDTYSIKVDSLGIITDEN